MVHGVENNIQCLFLRKKNPTTIKKDKQKIKTNVQTANGGIICGMIDFNDMSAHLELFNA